MTFRLLSPEQAAAVTSPILEPRQLLNGNFVVNETVMTDPAQEAAHAVLHDCPVLTDSEVLALLPPDPEPA